MLFRSTGVAPSGMFAEHYDYIIHLAAYAALRDSIENPEKFWENNVEKSKPIFPDPMRAILFLVMKNIPKMIYKFLA